MRTTELFRSPRPAAALGIAAGIIVFLGYQTYLTVVFSAADYFAEAGSPSRAILLSPNNAKHYLQRGETGDFEAAARVAPASAAPYLQMALKAELSGNPGEAAGLIGQAAARDNGFGPRWAAANLYFRNADWPSFWQSAREAASIYHGDLTALYRLCLRTGASGGEIYQKVTPPRTKATRELVALLLGENRATEAVTPAVVLAQSGLAKDKDLLLDLCDQLLAERGVDAASRLWAALPRFGPASGRCFDWRYRPTEGVAAMRIAESALQLELSGRQGDNALLVRRYFAIKPGRRYRLKYHLEHANDELLGSIGWVWNGQPVGTLRNEQIELAPSPGSLGELQLVSHRVNGSRRPEGAVDIDRITLAPVVLE